MFGFKRKEGCSFERAAEIYAEKIFERTQGKMLQASIGDRIKIYGLEFLIKNIERFDDGDDVYELSLTSERVQFAIGRKGNSIYGPVKLEHVDDLNVYRTSADCVTTKE